MGGRVPNPLCFFPPLFISSSISTLCFVLSTFFAYYHPSTFPWKRATIRAYLGEFLAMPSTVVGSKLVPSFSFILNFFSFIPLVFLVHVTCVFMFQVLVLHICSKAMCEHLSGVLFLNPSDTPCRCNMVYLLYLPL